MPLAGTDIIWRPAALTSDTTPAQNGGRMVPNVTIATGIKNNIFPDVSEAERQAGSTRYRKQFVALANTDTAALQAPRLFLDKRTPGDDGAVFYIGTYTDTQNTLTGSGARPYGVGALQADVAPSDDTLDVVLESAAIAALQPFRDGDTVRISSRPVGGTGGTEEFGTVADVTYDGAVATLLLTEPLAQAHDAADTMVSSVYEPDDDLAAAVGSPTVTSAAGTLNATKLTTTNKGAIAQAWTITFTSATAFTLSGDGLGAGVATGNTSINFSPANPNGAAYFTLDFSAFGGTWAPGDTITFNTTPAAVPVWYRREVPAGTTNIGNDYISLAITGEAA